MSFKKQLDFRWSDFDINFHLNHSIYYEFGAQARVEMLAQYGITLEVYKKEKFGPVLFREECTFKKEIMVNEKIWIDAALLKVRDDLTKFSIIHHFYKEDGSICATIIVEGAWIDTVLRKVTKPSLITRELIEKMPKDVNFEFYSKS